MVIDSSAGVVFACGIGSASHSPIALSKKLFQAGRRVGFAEAPAHRATVRHGASVASISLESSGQFDDHWMMRASRPQVYSCPESTQQYCCLLLPLGSRTLLAAQHAIIQSANSRETHPVSIIIDRSSTATRSPRLSYNIPSTMYQTKDTPNPSATRHSDTDVRQRPPAPSWWHASHEPWRRA